MLQPIQKDHELVCPGCGVVLQNIEEFNSLPQTKMPISLNVTLLGSALDKHVKYSLQSTPSQLYEEKVLRALIHLTKQVGLPERFVEETFKQMKRKNRGFRSETEYIKQLLKILSKDENYIHIHKMRLIKARYEKSINC